MDYHYVVKQVEYHDTDGKTVTSIDNECRKKCIDNIKLLQFLALIKSYLYKFQKIVINPQSTDESIIISAINSRIEIIYPEIDENIKELEKMRLELKEELDDIKKNNSNLEKGKLNRIVYDKTKSNQEDLFTLSKEYKIESFNDKFYNIDQTIINEFSIDESTRQELINFGNTMASVSNYLGSLNQERKQILENYFITNMILLCKQLDPGSTDIGSSATKIIDFCFKYMLDDYRSYINVELEQLTIVEFSCKRNVSNNNNNIWYMALYEKSYRSNDNLIISMFTIDSKDEVVNFYICKNITYNLKKEICREPGLGNAAMIIHSFSMHYFNKNRICTSPITSMLQIFNNEKHKLRVFPLPAIELTSKIRQLSEIFKGPRCFLEPKTCVAPKEDSLVPIYWSIDGNTKDIEETKTEKETIITLLNRTPVKDISLITPLIETVEKHHDPLLKMNPPVEDFWIYIKYTKRDICY